MEEVYMYMIPGGLAEPWVIPMQRMIAPKVQLVFTPNTVPILNDISGTGGGNRGTFSYAKCKVLLPFSLWSNNHSMCCFQCVVKRVVKCVLHSVANHFPGTITSPTPKHQLLICSSLTVAAVHGKVKNQFKQQFLPPSWLCVAFCLWNFEVD